MRDRPSFSVQKAGLPAAAEEDVFAYAHRVPALADLLQECVLPFVVAVEGEWGRGKSSFLHMLVGHVAQLRRPKRRWQVVHYHPWRYDIRSFDDAWESLVEVIDRQISGPRVEDRIGSLSQRVAENRLARLLWRLGLPAAGLLVPGAAAVADGLATFGERVQQYLQRPEDLGPGFLVFERVREQLAELARDRPLLIVIDDLDRCPPAAVSQVLRCIATLFAPAGPRAAFLLALDRRITVRSLMKAEGWEEDDASQFLEKIVSVHVTLPIVGVGEGDRAASFESVAAAIRGAGCRTTADIELPGPGGVRARRDIPPDRIEAIVRFLQFNPRRIERFCILFDLKWNSRFTANAAAALGQRPEGWSADGAQLWMDRFRDRLIWEALVELRWPLYDAKTGDVAANKRAIRQAIAGETVDAGSLPCAPYLTDQDFLTLHDLYFTSWSGGRQGNTAHPPDAGRAPAGRG